jgi:streptogramin lyase
VCNPIRTRRNGCSVKPACAANAEPTKHAEQPSLGFGSLWVTTDSDDTLRRVDTATGAISAEIKIPANIVGGNQIVNPINVAVADETVWVLAQTPDRALFAVDPATNTVTRSIPAPADSQVVAAGAGSLWVLTVRELVRIDSADGTVLARIPASEFPFMLADGEEGIWADFAEARETIVQVDPVTNDVVTKTALPPTGRFAIWRGGVSFGGGFVWSNSPGALLVQIDPATAEIVNQYIPGELGGAVAATDQAVWFSDYAANKLYRLPLR